MKKASKENTESNDNGLFVANEDTPKFSDLIDTPLVKDKLPVDFNKSEEVKHLLSLYKKTSLSKYCFENFVHSGGSGMVFKVRNIQNNNILALKIARKKLFDTDKPGNIKSLSPVSVKELNALQNLSHPNVVRLYDSIADGEGKIVAIATTYVDEPQPLNLYITNILALDPKQQGINPFSPSRLENACKFLVQKFIEIASAIDHMHIRGYYHMDIKPANILLSKKHTAMLTDLGSCIYKDDINKSDRLRAYHTWTYAHPDLNNMTNNPGGITGGGIKVSSEIEKGTDITKFDIFSFGRTMQETLAILEYEFGERCYANYAFRFLHFLACLCLDGKNALDGPDGKVAKRDGIRFVSDIALDYPQSIFEVYKIKSFKELMEKFSRFSRDYSWFQQIPELDPWLQDKLNTGVGEPTPYTQRVAKITGHPAFRRLKLEPQLGWMREVFPGATHNRWSHSIGVFSAVLDYYNALLADSDVPAFRIIVTPEDIKYAMLAALIHDLGQFSFGHDLEAAIPEIYDHNNMIEKLLNEKSWGEETLSEVIKEYWGMKIDGKEKKYIDIKRIVSILSNSNEDHPIDGIATDIINSPIDADKYDYLFRDSIGCGVTYGLGIDKKRFLLALTVSAKEYNHKPRFALSYKAKGVSAIESLLLARYQMFGAVYWHHTYRCIQAMYSHAASTVFSSLIDRKTKKIKNSSVSFKLLQDIVYHWVVCGKSLKNIEALLRIQLPKEMYEEVPPIVSGERAIELIWKFADDNVRKLIENLCRRELYKRVYEVSIGELGTENDSFYEIQRDLTFQNRHIQAAKIEENIFNFIGKAMSQKGPIVTTSENAAKDRLQQLDELVVPKIVIDFPTRGIPDEKNFPSEISDSSRKYLSATIIGKSTKQIFKVVRDLQIQSVVLRVYAHPDLHELIIRYMGKTDVEVCVKDVITTLKKNN